MKIKIEKKYLINLVKMCNSIIDNLTSSPIIQGLYISAKNNKLSIISTNGVVSIKSETLEENECQIIEEGNVLVKSKTFFSIIQKLKNESVLLEKVDNSILKIKTNNFDSNINLLDENQYPVISFSYEGWEEIQIQPAIFKAIQTKIIHSVSQNKEKVSVLNGVHISVKNKNMEIVGSDSYRLSYLLFKCNNSDFDVILDSYILTILMEILDHSNNVNLYISENNIMIKFKNYIFSTKIIEGEYPNISNIIKSPRLNNCLINKRELLEALERGITIAASEKKPISKLIFSQEFLNVMFNNVDLGSSDEKINIEKYNGKEITISVNAFFLISLLKAVENDVVIISTSDENKPIIITDEKEQNFIQLLLPVRNI